VLGLVAVSLLATAACNKQANAGSARWTPPASSAAPSSAAVLTITPQTGAGEIKPKDPVTVTVSNGSIDSVSVVNDQGKPVAGVLADDHASWKSSEPLGYARTYTATATAKDSAGRAVTRTSEFRTVKPANLTLPYLRANANLLLSSRKSFGVGQVIIVGFDEPVPDKAAAERTLKVTTEPAVEGSWHWYGNSDVHWRPKAYWPAGTKVTVSADVYGVHLGGGLYGQQDVSTSFTIGQSNIAIADDKTFHIDVYIDGQKVNRIPTAMGLHQTVTGDNGQKIDLRTRSGVHVVLGNDQKVRMTSKSWGLSKGEQAYDEDVFWTTHISYAGEYIHAAPWSVAQQGNSDASHGCLNVNTANAQWFFNNFGPGDVVDVRNTGLALDSGDGITDWNVPWDQWVAGSALK